MRVIGTLNDFNEAARFSEFLSQKGISNQMEAHKVSDWGDDNYGTVRCSVWINDEDQVEEAVKWLDKFKQNSRDPLFDVERKPEIKEEISEVKEEIAQWEKQPMGIITKGILILCILLFIMTEMTNPAVESNTIPFATPVYASPIEKAMLYDYPETYQLVDRFIKLYGYNALKNPEQLPVEAQYLVNKINQTPFWLGLYDYILYDRLAQMEKTPWFEKIREGEWWRLISPCFLHGSILHIFFNMLWLMVVGKQIEMRLLPFRYLLFILVTGIFSNTAQYLVGGFNFIGFSGVIAAMLGYIWARQKKAPWEGYVLDRMTFLFVTIFILGVAGVQALGFVLEYFFKISVSPGVANTAHITGALAGIALAQLEFFKWK